jgi:hypothetical protein
MTIEETTTPPVVLSTAQLAIFPAIMLVLVCADLCSSSKRMARVTTSGWDYLAPNFAAVRPQRIPC